ncbi:hypothetical protein HLK59_13490 [Streptomyces sp. S3(2020)]|uniref:hypothetical protein n=1 Tax=Streptomyces sp. S3(2020) TaxID=2732044 RepID=UPI001488ACEE|nr:hypothetical protein [Streptomyces sp. S3(2020)]NNN31364.1 hypothetical protein [Streptomyces sp. S3(2020)]
MKRKFGRAARVALAVVVACGVNVGLLATSASASENTWIRSRDYGYCLHAGDNGIVGADGCTYGDPTELWDRSGSFIKLAYTNLCLSNFGWGVYWVACVDSPYQRWAYHSPDSWGNVVVQNQGSAQYLNYDPYTGIISTQRDIHQYWGFSGGE